MSEIVEAILKMRQALEESKPILYYGTSDYVEEGKVLLSEKTGVTPRFIVCNPNDVERIKRECIGVRLVHLREYVPTVDDLPEFKPRPIRLTPVVSDAASPPSVGEQTRTSGQAGAGIAPHPPRA